MNLIVAVSSNFAIGKDNHLLFNIPTDLKYFKEKTMNKVVVMGEKTFWSLPFKPLKNRVNVVLSSKSDFEYDGVRVVHSLQELFDTISQYNTDDVFVIGGGSVYNALMPYCKHAYITMVDREVEDADTFITNIDKISNWSVSNESEPVSENGETFTFRVYDNSMVKDFESEKTI